MKLSVKSDYAARAVLSLARRYGKEAATRVEDLAAENGIPANYLVQILIDLKSGHIVKSLRGKEGGYQLARPPAEITFAQLIRCVHGSLFDSPALSDPGCPPALKEMWERLGQAVEREASSVHFQRLVELSTTREGNFDI